MTNYIGLSEPDLLEALGTDAKKWADAFHQMYPEFSHGLMLTWFSNALIAGHNEGVGGFK